MDQCGKQTYHRDLSLFSALQLVNQICSIIKVEFYFITLSLDFTVCRAPILWLLGAELCISGCYNHTVVFFESCCSVKVRILCVHILFKVIS